MTRQDQIPAVELWYADKLLTPLPYTLNQPLMTVGRDRVADIYLPDPHKKVSRYHAVLLRQPGGEYGIRDIGSLAGIQVNGSQ